MWNLLLPFLSAIGGKIGDYFTQLNELRKQELETQRQIEVAKQQMASDIAKTQLELNKSIVAATGSRFKYFTFLMWFGPFMVGVVSPSKSNLIFENLSHMPDWYVQSCMVIMFAVWGISVSAPVVGNIFSGLSSFMADRRQYKLEKAKIDRHAVFIALREKLFPKGMTQEQVDAIDAALTEGEK